MRPATSDAATHAVNATANTTPAANMPGANAGKTVVNASTLATANSTRVAICSGARSFSARACTALSRCVFSAAHAAPALRHIVRPSKPVTSVNGESNPSSGTPA